MVLIMHNRSEDAPYEAIYAAAIVKLFRLE